MKYEKQRFIFDRATSLRILKEHKIGRRIKKTYWQFNRDYCNCQTLHYGYRMHSDTCPVFLFHSVKTMKEKAEFLKKWMLEKEDG